MERIAVCNPEAKHVDKDRDLSQDIYALVQIGDPISRSEGTVLLALTWVRIVPNRAGAGVRGQQYLHAHESDGQLVGAKQVILKHVVEVRCCDDLGTRYAGR